MFQLNDPSSFWGTNMHLPVAQSFTPTFQKIVGDRALALTGLEILGSSFLCDERSFENQ